MARRPLHGSPDADGIAVARYARSRRPETAIIFLTAHPHVAESAAAWAGAPVILLAKPVDYAALLLSLGASLGIGTQP
jgi:DNA-binding LytR/AlgR family response regulator